MAGRLTTATLSILIIISGLFSLWSILSPSPMKMMELNDEALNSSILNFKDWYSICHVSLTGFQPVSNETAYYSGREFWFVELNYWVNFKSNLKFKVHGYLVYPKNNRNLPLLLILHGIKGWSDILLDVALNIANNGYAVLLIDLPGYGKTSNCTSIETLFTEDNVEDNFLFYASMAVRGSFLLTENLSFIDPERIGICGYDVGGFIAYIVGALDDDVKLIVTVFSSGDFIMALSSGGLINSLIPWNIGLNSRILRNIYSNFDPLIYAHLIEKPILLISSTNDEYFPLESYNKTFNHIVSSEKYLYILPNSGSSLEGKFINIMVNFLNSKFRKSSEQSAPSPLIYSLSLPLINISFYKLNCNGLTYFRPALAGFPWIMSGDKILLFSILPSGFEIYGLSGHGEDESYATQIQLIRGNLLLPVILILAIIYLTYVKAEFQMLIRLLYWLLLTSFLFLPLFTIIDRFSFSVPQIIERYGFIMGGTLLYLTLVLIAASWSFLFSYYGRYLMATIPQFVNIFFGFIFIYPFLMKGAFPIPHVGFTGPIILVIIVLIYSRRKTGKVEYEDKLLKVLPPSKEEKEESN
ncbi:MAG: acetylxylan esterase [Candidatus Verstraetearchaeota archaeon]|nr:acetylxylan esterase [Candidatus Verstraetearchaeota archaeon]